MKLSRQQPCEPAKQAEAPVADLVAQRSAHALPDAFRAQAQAPSVRGLATMMSVASGAACVPDYDQPTVDLGIETPVRQIDTPEFKAWFAGSKIVNRHGPIIVYHGSDADFHVFENGHDNGWSKERNGFYFTDDSEMAAEFGEVREFYLAIKSPADFTTGDPAAILKRIVACLPAEVAQKYEGKSEIHCLANGLLQTNEFLDAAALAGFDGIIIDDRLGGGRCFTSFIALAPTQIKFATDNGGTFSPTDPDIRR